MKLKPLVLLSSFLVLTILIVCVSVYAYNAYCTASLSACRATGSVNNSGLFNGSYTVSARVDGHQNGTHGNFADEAVSRSAVVDRPDGSCSSGSAYASVSGVDAQGRHHHRSDDAAF